MKVFKIFCQRMMMVFFDWLYHSLAWAYDWVAGLVSFGRWYEWGKSVLPFVKGSVVLELGYGTGHLQQVLNQAGFATWGVDESWQMALRSGRRIGSKRLIRGRGQSLPFRNHVFDCVVAIFPAPYLFETETLREIGRVLQGNGRLVILPGAWIVGRGWAWRVLAWFYRITGESPDLNSMFVVGISERLVRCGFSAQITWVEENGARLMIVQGDKKHFFVG
jgi:ubiquinone/menaquinone biosynthesis C-methylase UbiE